MGYRKTTVILGIFSCWLNLVAQSIERTTVEANLVTEVTLTSVNRYANPFTEIELNAVVTQPDGNKLRIPMFWVGNNQWSLRYASNTLGEHTYETECSDSINKGLHRQKGSITVETYKGNNSLYQHGPIRIANDKRHFEHQDGTPFLWLADTWWKSLCKRMTWEGFQEITADRKAKGFNVIQIVCGPYPDEEMLEERWENEGGMPYEKIDFSVMNPKYFKYADRRIEHLIDNGIVPVIVGGWGRPQDGGKSTLMQVGLEGYKRHWRNLVARYAAYPTAWMIGGEAKDEYGPWPEVAQYVKDIDAFKRVSCYHAPGHPRTALKDNSMFDFDMLAIGHDGMETVDKTFELMQASIDASPKRPIVCGEACYEGHMQTNRQGIQRYMFWSFMLSGAAGHTYGAAGIWHAGVEGDAGHTGFKGSAYDHTTWKQGMDYPGSTQIGIGKKLLEQYPWQRFETHPEWVEEGNFAAGIPGEVRFIYLPRRGIYDWEGRTVKDLDPTVNWHIYYFDPGTGRKFDQGIIKASAKPGDKGAQPVEFNKTVPSPQDWVLVLEKVDE